MAFDPDELPVTTLFRGKTFNRLTRHIIRNVEETPTDWMRANDFHEILDVSPTAFGNAQEQLQAYGLLERSASSDEAAMPRYRIPDSDVVNLLRDFHAQYDPTEDPDMNVESVFLPDLMELNGRARLIVWFLAAADRENQYSINKMSDAAPVGHTTVRDHIQSLVDHGIVTTDETNRGSQTYTVYQFNDQSAVAAVLYELNEAAAAHREAYERT